MDDDESVAVFAFSVVATMSVFTHQLGDFAEFAIKFIVANPMPMTLIAGFLLGTILLMFIEIDRGYSR